MSLSLQANQSHAYSISEDTETNSDDVHSLKFDWVLSLEVPLCDHPKTQKPTFDVRFWNLNRLE